MELEIRIEDHVCEEVQYILASARKVVFPFPPNYHNDIPHSPGR